MMYGESNMETSINICKIYSQWEFVVWIRELKLGLCNNLEGCDGQGGGRGHIPMDDSYWCSADTKTTL